MSEPDQDAPPPDGGQNDEHDERFDKFENRLSQMASQLTQLVQGQKTEKLKQDLTQYEQTLRSKVSDGEKAITTAEASLATAVDEGDGSAVAKAQRALAEAVADHREAQMALNGYQSRVRDAEKREGGTGARGSDTQASDNDATNLNAWKQRNAEWYGVNTEMTKAAHRFDEQIRAAGAIAVGSPEYFQAIDRQMRHQYPDKFSGSPATSGGGSSKQSTGSRRGRIPQPMAEAWRKMGINIDDPKVVDRMLKNREKLVDKGILPREMATGQVRS